MTLGTDMVLELVIEHQKRTYRRLTMVSSLRNLYSHV
jgi:hypothetical protein